MTKMDMSPEIQCNDCGHDIDIDIDNHSCPQCGRIVDIESLMY